MLSGYKLRLKKRKRKTPPPRSKRHNHDESVPLGNPPVCEEKFRSHLTRLHQGKGGFPIKHRQDLFCKWSAVDPHTGSRAMEDFSNNPWLCLGIATGDLARTIINLYEPESKTHVSFLNFQY